MPWNEVMGKFDQGTLRSGSKNGPAVKNPKQAVAILLSEKRKAQGGNPEYKSKNSSLSKALTGGY